MLKRRPSLLCWLLLAGFAACVSSPRAQAAPPAAPPAMPAELSVPSHTLRVATREVPPFVVKQPDANLSGFSIALWEEIAKVLHVQTQYVDRPDVGKLLDAVGKNQADLGIAAISITAERDEKYDFSQPMYDSGLQVLVKGQAGSPSLWDGFTQLMGSPILRQFGLMALVLMIVPAHLIYFLETRHPEGIVRHRKYFPGIFEAIWWTVSCLATQAEEMPRHVVSRVLAVLWMFFAVIFIAFVTAALTANLTLQQLRGDIHGPQDLPGKKVGTVEASTSAEYLKAAGVVAKGYATVDSAITDLESGNLDAVVYDSPILLYYSANDGKGKVSVVGTVFRKEDYGIVFPPGSPWRKSVNVALLRLKENGVYDRLQAQWFGQPDAG